MEQAIAHVLTHDRAGMRVQVFANRGAWLQARRAIITSTDLAGIAGLSKWSSPLSIYAEKTKPASEADMIDLANEQQLLGQIFQRDIVTAYQLIRDKKEGTLYEVEHVPNYCLVFHASDPRHGTSMDCWQWTTDKETKVPLEVKKTSSYPEEPYDEWLTQVQWQMYVTGSWAATIAALCGGDEMRWWDIKRDDEVIGQLREMANRFISECVMPQLPPPSDGSESSRRAMKSLFPQSQEGLEVALDINDLDAVTRIQDLGVRIKALEAEQGTLEDGLKAKMGAAEVAYLPNGGKITWKSFSKAAYMVKEQVVRPFRIYAEPTQKGKRRGA